MARQTGRATVSVNGDILATKADGATMDPGGRVREGDMTSEDTFFYKEQPKKSTVVVDIIHMTTTDVDAIRNGTEVTISFVTDTGQEWVIAGAVYEDSDAITDGMWKVTFAGPPAKRVA